jgi:predicted lipoprotein with Yx(FWY)xxD motif
MKHRKTNWLTIGLGLGSTLLLGMTACRDEDGGISLPTAGSAGSAGTDASGGTGSGNAGSASADAGDPAVDPAGGQGGETAASGGSSAGKSGGKAGSNGSGGSRTTNDSGAGGETDEAGGEGGSPAAGSGGAPSAGSGGTGATGGDNAGTGGTDVAAGTGGTGGDSAGSGGSGGSGPLTQCIYHSDPAPQGGGEGGAPAAPGGVEVATNAFLGPYLTDLAGMTLYIYGADVPGDCNNPPVSNCSADCAIAWPIFDAKERGLDETLDDSVFGTLDRGDGTFQTTYYGWPLYYYKSDTAPNTINGQGKGKTWFTAEVKLPNLMIMRGPVSGGGVKYLSDDRGYTLYSLPTDTVGNGGSDPVSACSGSCLDSFRPFAPGDVFPVTPLEPRDITLFFRGDGTLQTAFKGAPLYYSTTDVRPGQQNGVNLLGGALVAP